jgi:hypothetical protein
MNQIRFYRWLAAGLLLSNLMLLAFLFWRNSQPEFARGSMPPRPEGPRNEIIERLHLDRAQTEAYDALIHEHRREIHDAQEQIRGLKEQLYQHLTKSDSRSDTDSLIQAIGDVQMSIERIHYRHFQAIGALCRPEQRADFEKLTRDLTQLFQPPRRP